MVELVDSTHAVLVDDLHVDVPVCSFQAQCVTMYCMNSAVIAAHAIAYMHVSIQLHIPVTSQAMQLLGSLAVSVKMQPLPSHGQQYAGMLLVTILLITKGDAFSKHAGHAYKTIKLYTKGKPPTLHTKQQAH